MQPPTPGGASGPSIFLNVVQDQVRAGEAEGEVQRSPGARTEETGSGCIHWVEVLSPRPAWWAWLWAS